MTVEMEEADDPNGEASGELSSRHGLGSKDGRAVAEALLREAIGSQIGKVCDAPAYCLAVRVKTTAWVGPIISAARKLGYWAHIYNATGRSSRQKEEQEAECFSFLARGQRVLVVSTLSVDLPARLSASADLVVDVKHLTVSAVSRVIRLVTKGRARGLRQEDLDATDLVETMASIRPGTTAASCVRRIRSSRRAAATDPMVATAPLLSELRGYGDAQIWAEQLIDDLGRWRRGEIKFADIQRNAVLAGGPGVGKSSFVRSLARTADLPLVATSVGTLFASTPGYLDSICKGIDDVFANARAAGETAIVFFDEMEGFPSRSNLEGRHASWWTPVVNHMLTALDSAMSATSSQLIVVGATNFPERLDAALTRFGRMDRVLWIDRPGFEDLIHIYRQHLGDDLVGCDLTGVAELGLGSTGADVVGQVKSARTRARTEGRAMEMNDLVEAIVPASRFSDADIRRAAVHEAGHAVAALLLEGPRIRSVTIGGEAEGGRIVLERDRYVIGDLRSHRNEVVRLLAGRAAEETVLGSVSAGAGGGPDSDLARATVVVAADRLSMGLGGTLAYIAAPQEAMAYVRAHPAMLQAVERDLQDIYGEALALIRQNQNLLLAISQRLIADRSLSGDALRGMAEPFIERDREITHA